MIKPSSPPARPQAQHVYNAGYKGTTYAVKYLGIVDGAMGILSRKMAMPNTGADGKPTVTERLDGRSFASTKHSVPVNLQARMQMAEPDWKMDKL